jgi:hypothetical protein
MAVFLDGFDIILDKTVDTKRLVGSEMHSLNINM